MQLNRAVPLIILSLLVILAACTQQAQELPTLIPTATIPEATNTPEPTPTETQAPPTLPPTWTPTFTETVVPTETEVFPTATPLDASGGLPEACNTFAVDGVNTQVEFEIGASPIVAWTPVEGAELYRVTLSDQFGRILKDDIYIAETQYQFSPDFFELNTVYGWSVIPLDAVGDQMCFPRGLELIPFRPRPS